MVLGLVLVVAIAVAAYFLVLKDNTTDTDAEPTNETETTGGTESTGTEGDTPISYDAIKTDPEYGLALTAIKEVCDAGSDFEELDYGTIAALMAQDPEIDPAWAEWFSSQTGTFQLDDYLRFLSEYAAEGVVEGAQEEGVYEGNEAEVETLRVAVASDIYDVCSGARTVGEITAS